MIFGSSNTKSPYSLTSANQWRTMSSNNPIIEIVHSISAEELRKAVILACNSDRTGNTRDAIWSECLAITSRRPFPPERTDSAQKTTDQLAPDPDDMKMARISQIHRELHSNLANLAYGVCTVYEIPTPSTVISNADATFRDRFENTRDRRRELQLFARETRYLLCRSSEVLSQGQEAQDWSTSVEQVPLYSQEDNVPSATWRGLNDPRWDKFNRGS
ncbi:hypothetical protein F5Y06DRAFT_299969 [Hypoxylon sp. FL0890]|nr:hypothetical protein F5Y06DRAFT_299969 [Hypoxylon sp. FL0890]